MDQHQQMTWQPKSSLTVETSHWTSSNMDSVPLPSSSRLWDLDFQIKLNIYFHLKVGLWTTEQQSRGLICKCCVCTKWAYNMRKQFSMHISGFIQNKQFKYVFHRLRTTVLDHAYLYLKRITSWTVKKCK